MVNKINDADFGKVISNNEKVVVKFYADWCGNCRLFAPKFNRLSEKDEHKDVTFVDVNAEQSPEARKLAGVSNLPFFATFKNGSLHSTDFTSKEEVVERLIKGLQESI